jgi:hypothetical protein
MLDSKTIVAKTLIPHRAFEEASRRLDQCFEYAQSEDEPVCIALVGESRTGKSRAIEGCLVRHPIQRTPDGLVVPILRVKTPPKPTVKALAELMLRGLNDPLFDKGTENAKTIRLRKLITSSGVVMVAIDEFQHFVDKGSLKVMHHVADWLKVLVDDCGVALVVAGLPRCQAVLEQNEQLAGRFMSPIFMPRFDWQDQDQREEFTEILGAFHESLSAHFELPALDAPELAFRCYCATGGLMGYLTKFLRQAVWNALDRQSNTIDLEALCAAHQEAVWSMDGIEGMPNPFSRQFVAEPTIALISRIRALGQAVEPPPVSRARPRKMEKMGVRELLSAS